MNVWKTIEPYANRDLTCKPRYSNINGEKNHATDKIC